MRTWFITLNEQTKGPFTQEEIKNLLSDGSLPLDCQIWGRGQPNWILASNWVKSAASTVSSDPAKAKQDQAWHYAVKGVSKGPMPRAQLVVELRDLRDKDEVLVWTKGMKSWVDLFEFHDLLDEVGLDRREHPRASIEGQVVIRTDEGKTIIAQLKQISPGGLGVGQVIEALNVGEVVQVEIKSNMLGEAIATKATVQYITGSAFIGLKFVSISMENKSRILEYVRSAEPTTIRAAA